jgi:hypothetical protein
MIKTLKAGIAITILLMSGLTIATAQVGSREGGATGRQSQPSNYGSSERGSGNEGNGTASSSRN